MTKIKQTKGSIRSNKRWEKNKFKREYFPKYPRNSYPEVEPPEK